MRVNLFKGANFKNPFFSAQLYSVPEMQKNRWWLFE